MKMMIRTTVISMLKWQALILLAVILPGCVNTTTVKQANAVPAAHAEQEIPEAELLNVNVAVFDPGIPADLAEQDEPEVFPGVREAEARYLAFNLRATLQQTGYWGAVRVVPDPIEHSELLVTGKILESNGLVLKLQIMAEDATGRVWLEKVYEHEATQYNYTESLPGEKEQFQALYNRIADDLLAARRELSAGDLHDIQQVSQLRFAAGLAPEVFDRYLTEKGNHLRLAGLPAAGDPMMARIERVRQRDDMVIDTLDQHYRLFHEQLAPSYGNWRAASYTEAKKLRELRREALTRQVLGAISIIGGIVGLAVSDSSGGDLASGAAVVGGAYLYKSGMDKESEATINREALEELGQSLENSVSPQVVELQGRTVTLSGSAKAQYAEWRGLLKDIYAAETGFTTGSTEVPAPDDR